MSGLARRSLGEQAVSPSKLLSALKENAYATFKWPSVPPTAVSAVNGFADPTGATGDSNFITFHGLVPMVAANHIKGAGQTLLIPTEDATNGWLAAGLDAAVSEGVEYLFGGKETIYNPFAMTVGDSAARNKFVRIKFQTDDVENLAECALGFRGDSFEANLDDYTDLAALNIQFDTTAKVRIETILADAATVTTETGKTLADATDITLEVRMMGGVPRFYVNGQEFRTSFVFADTTVIYPFFFWLQNATAGSVLGWKELTVGAYNDEDESNRF